MIVNIYSTEQCHYCNELKEFMKDNGLPFEEFNATNFKEWILKETGRMAIPVVEIVDGDDSDTAKVFSGYTDELKDFLLENKENIF